MSKISWAGFVVVAVVTGMLTASIPLRIGVAGLYLVIAFTIAFLARRRTLAKSDKT
jgi:hypothetical protein